MPAMGGFDDRASARSCGVWVECWWSASAGFSLAMGYGGAGQRPAAEAPDPGTAAVSCWAGRRLGAPGSTALSLPGPVSDVAADADLPDRTRACVAWPDLVADTSGAGCRPPGWRWVRGGA